MNNDKKQNGMIVDQIKDGLVIDHMPAGSSLRVLAVLNLTNKEFLQTDKIIAVAMNVRSDKSGRKDVLKISDHELSETMADLLGLVIPGATLNLIRGHTVVQKKQLAPPAIVSGLVCPAENCITNFREDITPQFQVTREESSFRVRCTFCEQNFIFEDRWRSMLPLQGT